MPGDDAGYSDAPDLFPPDDDSYTKLVSWCSQAFIAAESASQENRRRWKKYYRLYRSYVRRDLTSWRMQAFIPYTFSFIESITPKILAEPPKPVVQAVGPEDAYAAKLMETELDRAVTLTKLHVEMIKAGKSSLKYGTGILKTYWKQEIRTAWERVPVMEPTPEAVAPPQDVVGNVMTDINGEPMIDAAAPAPPAGAAPFPGQMQPKLGPDGQPMMETKPFQYIGYEGPAAEWVDIFKFYVAPEAEDVQDARYVIQQVWRSEEYIQAKIDEGVYRLPPGMSDAHELTSSRMLDPREDRRHQVGEDSIDQDTTDKPIELWEFHTDDNRLITMANRAHVIRVVQNPYWHGEKPFVRMVDYVQEGEFWGVGEIEAIEGLQDIQNAIWNQRIDNVRLAMDRPKAIHVDSIFDDRDLVSKPGQTIRIHGDRDINEAMQWYDTPDVTSSAYTEAQMIEAMMERVTGASAYTIGTDSQTLNKTATGVALLSEAGNTKFAHKVLLMELMCLQDLFRHWGALMQQFVDEPRMIRQLGPAGQILFAEMSPESIQGSLDYTIQAKSTTQTESVRKDQAMQRLQVLATVYPTAVPKAVMDYLESDGVVDFTPYLFGIPDLQMMMAQQQAIMSMQQMQGGGETGAEQQGEPVGADQGGGDSGEDSGGPPA